MMLTERQLRAASWTVALALGALQAWVHRHRINPDGISYLDLADALVRHDWNAAISTYWSPLYPVLLAVALGATNPSPYNEFALLHVVNFVVFACTLCCFEFFLRSLLRYRAGHRRDQERVLLSDRMLQLVGYMAFIWTSLDWISVGAPHPDMCVSALVYLAAGGILRVQLRPNLGAAFLCGMIVGIGYLAKTIMLPVGVAFLLASAVGVWRDRRAVAVAGLSIVGFVSVAAPLVGVLSLSKNRFTVGDVGVLSYAWFVNGVMMFAHWQGGAGQVPLHAPRKVLANPPVYEYATPIKGTFPLWFDPAYWHEGLRIDVDVAQQSKRIVYTTNAYLRLLLNASGKLNRVGNWMFGPLALLLAASGGGPGRRSLWKYQCLLLPAASAVGFYWLVHVDPRFLAAFVVLLLLGFLAAADQSPTTGSGFTRGAVAATAAIWLSAILSLGQQTISGLIHANGHLQWRVAQELHKMDATGIRTVAVAGNAFEAYWARLARVRIVSDMPQEHLDEFWGGGLELRRSVVEAFAATGAEVVVADSAPAWAVTEGWAPLGMGYHAYLLRDRRGTHD